MSTLEIVLREEREDLAAMLEKYGNDHHRHVDNYDGGPCDHARGDRCDITAAYRHAARLVRAGHR